MRLFKKNLNGYFTIEASVLVPAAFFLFAMIIHLSFMMYGRCMLAQDTYLMAFRASLLRHDEDAVSFIQNYHAAQFGEKYFGNEQPAMSGQKNRNYITATAASATHRAAFDLAPSGVWEIGATARAIDIDIPARIRKIDRIADIAAAGLRALR